ncbi:MAG: hypothetical protein D6744_07255, partial [Planctomycetota bacterium]
GRIVFFYHDSDHDPRETRTVLHHRKTDETAVLNFDFENKIQRRFSPLYLKRIPRGWREKMIRQLPAYVDRGCVDAFATVEANNVADFCLGLYRNLGLLDGIEVARSSDPAFREAACSVDDFFVDIPYEGEVVRARRCDGGFQLHEGGNRFIELPDCEFGKTQISPTRDSRLKWMQSVIHCTHYVAGASEANYMKREDAPEITYLQRDPIDRSDEAHTDFNV